MENTGRYKVFYKTRYHNPSRGRTHYSRAIYDVFPQPPSSVGQGPLLRHSPACHGPSLAFLTLCPPVTELSALFTAPNFIRDWFPPLRVVVFSTIYCFIVFEITLLGFSFKISSMLYWLICEG